MKDELFRRIIVTHYVCHTQTH